jgi:hypothetical protein
LKNNNFESLVKRNQKKNQCKYKNSKLTSIQLSHPAISFATHAPFGQQSVAPSSCVSVYCSHRQTLPVVHGCHRSISPPSVRSIHRKYSKMTFSRSVRRSESKEKRKKSPSKCHPTTFSRSSHLAGDFVALATVERLGQEIDVGMITGLGARYCHRAAQLNPRNGQN